MRLELRELKDGCLEQQYCCSPDEFPALEELQANEQVRFDQPICFQLRLQKSGQIVEVDGQLQTRVGFICGRCLNPFGSDIQADFCLTFTPLTAQADLAAEEEVELDAEELGLISYQEDILELLAPLQEQILLALPISPLCASGCLGLCAECGCDLNKESCTCEKTIFNNKFGSLSGLKVDLKK